MTSEVLLRSFKLPTPLFKPKSAWNQTADEVAVQTDNSAFVATTLGIFADTGVSPNIWVSHETYTYPVFLARLEGEPQVGDIQIRSYDGNEWPPVMLPWYKACDDRVFVRGVPHPGTKVRPSGPKNRDSDGSLILYNPNTKEEYDFWQATTALDKDGSTLGGGYIGTEVLSAGGVAYFKVDGPGAQLPVCDARAPTTLPRGSCRATGVPYLAGLFVPEDLALGARSEIAHALAFVLPRLRHIPCPTADDPPDYVYPATNTESHDFIRNPLALAAGQRIRLKQELVDDAGVPIDESEQNDRLAPITQIFFRALRRYGAYLVDGGSAFAFSAEDYHTAWLDLTDQQVNELIGADIHAALPTHKTKWQIVIDKLNEQLSWQVGGGAGHAISFATTLDDGTIQSNFEVIEDATPPDVNWLRHIEEDG